MSVTALLVEGFRALFTVLLLVETKPKNHCQSDWVRNSESEEGYRQPGYLLPPPTSHHDPRLVF